MFIKKNINLIIISICLLLISAFLFLSGKDIKFLISRPIPIEITNKIVTGVIDSQIIVGVMVVSVNLQKNARYSVYTFINDPELKTVYDRFIENGITKEVPFFTGNQIHDIRLTRIMNHEFICSPFKDTIGYKISPESGAKINTVCAVSIPPSYGNFKGIVGIYLKSPPTEIEQDRIRIFIKSIAEEVSLYM
jgi:hypothetical protein